MRDLSGFLVFAEAADTLSFVEAGRRLGISSSAVGKAVARLESQVGVRLFHRSTRRINLTQEGRVFHARCRRALDELEEAQAALSAAAARPMGRLRVSLPTIGYHFLVPHLGAFHGLYPGIALELDFNDQFVDVIAGGFDAVIRSGALPDSQLMARRLGAFRFVVVASPAYLAEHGAPRRPADLARHRRLLFRFHTTGKIQPWVFRGETLEGDRAAALTSNNMEAILAAALEGSGLAYMPDFLAAGPIAASGLRPVLRAHMGPPGAFWLLWPAGAQLTAKLRVFIDFMSPRLFGPSPPGRMTDRSRASSRR